MSENFAILPMKTAGTHHFIDRIYRESGVFQWVRETYINAFEEGATIVQFGIEWQAVEANGVYRRTIADNGKGMSSEQLVSFFNTFGGGGKPIGDPHQNFGVGAKTSLLPWNRYGMVVVSWKDGDASMIWVAQDPASGEYGLRTFRVQDPDTGEISLDHVCEPYLDEEHGCDWSLVKPAWIKEHGTVIVLLGNDPTYDTVEGDPTRAESDIKGISSYLNQRLWEVGKIKLTVDELRTDDKSKWPRTEEEGHGSQAKKGVDRRTNLRTIEGARHFIRYADKSFKDGKMSAFGTVMLNDGTRIDWFLWEGERPAVHSYAALNGFVAAEYRNELYDVSQRMVTYRSFGITDGTVRKRVWLVARPKELDAEGKSGVYPRTDRNALLIRGGPQAGDPLPWSQWGSEFSDSMPDEIRAAITAARSGIANTITDPSWKDRLAERFGARWRITKLVASLKGTLQVIAEHAGGFPRAKMVATKRAKSGGGGSGGVRGAKTVGHPGGIVPASSRNVGGAIPDYRTVDSSSVEPGMLAAWSTVDPEYPHGVVLLNVEHPVLISQIQYWQEQYADHLAEEIKTDVIDVYGMIAVAKVAHSAHLTNIIPPETLKDLRSDAALTMALIGLIAEEAVIATRIGGKYGGKRKTA
jgi:hypothetical protein